MTAIPKPYDRSPKKPDRPTPAFRLQADGEMRTHRRATPVVVDRETAESRLLTGPEVAGYLGVSWGTLERYFAKEALPGACKIGYKWRFSVPVFEAVLFADAQANLERYRCMPFPEFRWDIDYDAAPPESA